ncbi:acylphosphatase [Candidatus Parcubacteria bacterium]|nr:MAG: acylphosphatase [Candidatus Parcubacteria bacterium]
MGAAKRLVARVYGEVQGVSFRSFVAKKAWELGLTGFVRNETDGTVYLEAEGEEEKLEDLVAACREGNPYARIRDVRTELGETLKKFEGFTIA